MVPAIRILHRRHGAGQARGLAVVIDVLRAFSTACYVVDAGVRRICAVADVDSARRLKARYPRALLLGERNGYRLPGFDLGNSPSQAIHMNWCGRTAILTTSNGTAGLAAVTLADEVVTGSFVNAGAIVAYIRQRTPAQVSFVCMGSNGRPAIEDTLCALYLAAALKGMAMDFGRLKEIVMASSSAAGFLAADSSDMPPEDLDMCLNVDLFGFVLRAYADPVYGLCLRPIGPRRVS